MRTTSFAVAVTIATALRAEPLEDLRRSLEAVSGPHDGTGLIADGWARRQPQPKPTQARCERFLEIPNYYQACMEAVAGRPQEALRLLGISPRNDPAD